MDCPCCGRPIENSAGILIDVDGGFIAANGRVARLTETEFNLFHILWERQPRTLTKEALMSGAYSLRHEDEEPEIKIIDILVCKVRKKLLPLGIEIDTVWGRGYRILPNQGAPE